MAATLRFTLPDGFNVDELPQSLRPLVRSDANGHMALESRRPLIDLKTLADWALERGRRYRLTTV